MFQSRAVAVEDSAFAEGTMSDMLPASSGKLAVGGNADGLLVEVARFVRREASRMNNPIKPKAKTKQRPLKKSVHELRRRHRESMAQRRRRGRARITQLEGEAKQQQRRLRELLQSMESSRHLLLWDPLTAYVELVETAESLRDEQRALKAQLKRRNQYARLVACDADRLPETATEDDRDPPTPTACWVRLLDHEPPFRYEPVTPAQCVDAMLRHSHTMRDVRHTLSQLDPRVQREHCIGWYVERMVDKLHPNGLPTLRVRFTRRVSRDRTSMQHLQSLTWAMLNTPELTARVYGPTVVAKTVQRIDGDAFVVLRNSPDRSNHQRLRYFTLNSRSQSADGSSAWIDIAVLHKKPTNSSGVTWLDRGGVCVSFRHVEKHAIEIQYASFLQSVSDAHAAFLLLESCAALLRWEHLVVPPRLLP